MKRAFIVACMLSFAAGVLGSEIPVRKPDSRIVLSQKDGFLAGVFGFSVLEDGSLLIADGKDRKIVHFGKDGSRWNSWQKIGQGPGEFATASWNDYEMPFFCLFDGANAKLLLYRRESAEVFKWVKDIKAQQQFTLGVKIFEGRIYSEASSFVAERRYCISSTDLDGAKARSYLPAEIRYGLREGDDWKRVEPDFSRAWGVPFAHLFLYGDAIYSAWAGDSGIIKIGIKDGRWINLGKPPEHYTKPDIGSPAGRSQKRIDAEKAYSWTTGLFADSGVLGLLFNRFDPTQARWSLVLQTYDLAGRALNEAILGGVVPLGAKFISYAYCRTDGCLYVVNEEESLDDTDFVVYRYQIRK